MRINYELSAICQRFEMASPEAIKAQRQADLASLAEWRSRRLQAYQDWADPVKRAAIQEKARADLVESCRLARERQEKDPDYFKSLWNRQGSKELILPDGRVEELPVFSRLDERIKITPKPEPLPQPKIKWHQKLLHWLLACLEMVGF